MATEYVKGLERSRSSFEGGLYKSRCMAGFLVISDQTIADFSNRPKLEDDSFDGDGKYSDVYAKLSSCSKELPRKFAYSALEGTGTALTVS